MNKKVSKTIKLVANHFKSPSGIISTILLLFGVFALCLLDLRLPVVIELSREHALEIFDKRLDEIITLFGGSLAIFAIIFSIVQLKKDYEEVISFLFFETYFFPFLGVSGGIISSLVLSKVLFLGSIIDVDVFVEISILSVYCVVLELMFIICILYRIYKILTTDFLLEKFLENIKSLAVEEKKEIQTVYLFEQRKRLYNRYRQSIMDDDTILSDKISEVLIDIFIKNPNSYFTNDLGREIYLYFEDALNNNKRDAVYKVINIVALFWNKSIINNNIVLLERLQHHPTYFYDLIFKERYKKEELSEYLVLRYSEIYTITLSYQFKDFSNIQNLTEFNKYGTIIFRSFNYLLKNIVENKDYDTWEYCINIVNYMDGNITDKNFLRNKKIELNHLLATEQKNETEIKKLSELIFQQEFRYKTNRFLKFGLYAWLIDLWLRNKYSLEEHKKFTKVVNNEIDSLPTFIEDLLFYYSIDNGNDIMDWQRWTSSRKKQLPFTSGWIPYTSDWFVFAIVLKLLQENIIDSNFGIHIKSVQDSEQFNYILDSIKIILEAIENAYEDKYINFLQLEKAEFEKRKYYILSFFKALKTRFIEKQTKDIALTPLSQNKINMFKAEILKEWSGSKTIEDIFIFYNAVSKIDATDKSKELKRAYINTNLIDYKMMFIEGKYDQDIIGMNFGIEIARTVNNSFFIYLIEKTETTKIAEIKNNEIDMILEQIDKQGFEPDIIIADSKLLYSEYFMVDMKYDKKPIVSGILNHAYYKDILVIPIDNPLFDCKIIVAAFKSSFEMIQQISELWGEKILDIQISEITREKAEEEAKKAEGFEDLDQNEKDKIIYKNMNNVLLYIAEKIDFKILNTDAFKIVEVENCQ